MAATFEWPAGLGPASARPMNERAKRRLEIAEGLMPPSPQDILERIRTLPESDRDSLRSCVDWVEEYEVQERKDWWL